MEGKTNDFIEVPCADAIRNCESELCSQHMKSKDIRNGRLVASESSLKSHTDHENDTLSVNTTPSLPGEDEHHDQRRIFASNGLEKMKEPEKGIFLLKGNQDDSLPDKRLETRDTRKRKAKELSITGSSMQRINESWLIAFDRKGKEIRIKLIVGDQQFKVKKDNDLPDKQTPPSEPLGIDGNQHYCQVCRGFGDVVCCDGCPRVYHHKCIPLHSPSRISLDSDDDPWFCPECTERNATLGCTDTDGTEKQDRASSHRRCVDCMQSGSGVKLVPCIDCGAYIHSPSCIGGKDLDTSTNPRKVTCLNCRAIDRDDSMDTDASLVHDETRETHNSRYDTDGSNGEDEQIEAKHATKERKAKQTRATLLTTKSSNAAEADKTLKKKKKYRKRTLSTADLNETDDDAAVHQQSIEDDPILKPRGSSTIVQAIPAFCFYLAENRWKIERALSRKHRTFNRLPKGDERNALVAQEAAVWWTKLETKEHQLYISMSMRDFEKRIVQWKEEKDAREIGAEGEEYLGNAVANDEFVDGGVTGMDNKLLFDMHERLFLSTSVGSKPCKLEADQSYNRVLLDLLHDVRFHFLPMLSVNRAETDAINSEDHHNKVTIPHFDVHGPVSTSIGDECLGCSRGWTHFCPVLQRRVPAVEHRAKLQPPLSSLLATRIGLGLRPRFNDVVEESEEDHVKSMDDSQSYELFQWRTLEDNQVAQSLPSVPSCNVFDSNDRADDMVLFVEETVAMKIPEPLRPANPGLRPPLKKSFLKMLPTQRQRNDLENIVDESGATCQYNKCGRCRTIIPNGTGCVPCRRAQLVINKSKIAPSASPKHSDGKSLKVHTTMLGRLHAKEGAGDVLSMSDQKVSEAILKVRWCPSAIFPPQKVYTPTPTQLNHIIRCGDLDTNCTDDDGFSGTNQEETPELEETFPPMNGNEKIYEPPYKRVRTARLLSLADKEAIITEPDRPQLLKHYKKESADLYKKITRIACYGILHALRRRDPLHLFEEPVVAEGYSSFVQSPMDMQKIRENLVSGQYSALTLFVSDAQLVCENAMTYNPPASIYHRTAKEMLGALTVMQSRASSWIATIKTAHIKYLQSKENHDRPGEEFEDDMLDDPFDELRKSNESAVQMLDQEGWLKRNVVSDFRRTVENEFGFYGSFAICRAAAAAEASLAQYPVSCGHYSVVSKRKYFEDEDLRRQIDATVANVSFPQLKSVSTWREEALVRLLRKVQKLRLERRSNTEIGCSRCNITIFNVTGRSPGSPNTNFLNSPRMKKKGELMGTHRVATSRHILATGLASAKICQRIVQRSKDSERGASAASFTSVSEACVSVRGSKVHGMGLFADQPFSKGDVVAEYLGEYVVNPVAEAREKSNDELRIQDYQFRLDDTLVIDATERGGWGRYINHSCSPNCKTVIIPGDAPNQHLRRVMIVAKRSIALNEELSYDYQFPLELNLSARIPCNCQSDACRGFMNWDLPEKGTNNRALLVQKRGANMRDRIRRLGRPLKRGDS